MKLAPKQYLSLDPLTVTPVRFLLLFSFPSPLPLQIISGLGKKKSNQHIIGMCC